MKHFISTLGTSLYEPVYYGNLDTPEEYVQIAVLRSVIGEADSDLIKDWKITILLTDRAREQNWEDRIFTEKDESMLKNNSSRIDAERIKKGEKKTGLKEQIQKAFSGVQINEISIPDGKNTDETMDIFTKMYDAIDEGDEVVFDVTHGFRSIPLLAFSVIGYAKSLKNISIKGFYYGAYEAKTDGRVPIFDLTVYSDILDWTYAAELYSQFGDTSRLNNVYERIKRDNAKVGAKVEDWGSLSSIIKGMDTLSSALLTGRGADASCLNINDKKLNHYSIKEAVTFYKKGLERFRNEENEQKAIKPIYPILKKISGDLEAFDKKNNYEIGIETVRWSIANGMVQLGYTALEESIKTFLCYHYGLDELICRDKVIGNVLMGISDYKKNKKEIKDRKELQIEINENNKTTKEVYEDLSDMERSKWNEIISDIPEEFAILSSDVKERRNDINHFGFRPNPLPAQLFNKSLKEYLEQFELLVAKLKN